MASTVANHLFHVIYISFCFSLSLSLPLPHTIIYMDTPLEWHTPNIELIMYVRLGYLCTWRAPQAQSSEFMIFEECTYQGAAVGDLDHQCSHIIPPTLAW